MPNVIAHILSARRALESNSALRGLVAEDIGAFYLGAQGPDPLFYYNLKLGHFRSDAVPEARRLHREETGRTFATLLQNAGDDPVLRSYVAGWITHYTLDSVAHPYIYWMSGCSQSKLRKPRYSFYHQRFEADLDMALWEGQSMPRDWAWIDISDEKKRSIARLLSTVCALDESQLYAVLCHFVRTRRRLYDVKGRKYRGLLLVEQVLGMTDMISAGFYQRDTVDYTLNLEHNAWSYPWKPTVQRKESYFDLMDITHERNMLLLTAYADYCEGDCTAKQLRSLYGNRSYYTGLSCRSKAVMFAHDCIYERQEIRGLSGLKTAYNEG